MLPPNFRMINHGYNANDQHVALYVDTKDNTYWLCVNGRLMVGDIDRDKMDKLFQRATAANSR